MCLVSLRVGEGLSLEIEGDPCARALMATVLVDSQTQTMVSVKAHSSKGVSFLNLHVIGASAEFKGRCSGGILCDEARLDFQ